MVRGGQRADLPTARQVVLSIYAAGLWEACRIRLFSRRSCIDLSKTMAVRDDRAALIRETSSQGGSQRPAGDPGYGFS